MGSERRIYCLIRIFWLRIPLLVMLVTVLGIDSRQSNEHLEYGVGRQPIEG